MNKLHPNLVIVLLLIIGNTVYVDSVEAQQNILSLKHIIATAQDKSLSAERAKNTKENSYWSYQNIMSDLKPRLALQGTVPYYENNIQAIVQNDGSKVFRETQNLTTDLAITLDQNILWTGGSISVYSSLQRNEVYLGSNQGTTYAGNPFAIAFEQPLFSYNTWKWNKKIEPLRLIESEKAYKEEFVYIAYQTTSLFFDHLLAQITLSIVEKNKKNSDINYNIGSGRYNLGKIAENELLELELNALNSERDMSSAQLDVETTRLRLNTFIGISKDEVYELMIPESIPEFEVDLNMALEQAKKNRQQYVSFKRRALEAESEVARAKSEKTMDINIRGSVGWANQALVVGEVLNDPRAQQQIGLTLDIPILDWKRGLSGYKTAIANQRLVENTILQEEQEFEAEISTLVKQIPILRNRVISTKKGDEIADKRYNISQERYLVANISVTDLNLALTAKDQAKKAYLQALREYWIAYYQLRLLTLYDFEMNIAL